MGVTASKTKVTPSKKVMKQQPYPLLSLFSSEIVSISVSSWFSYFIRRANSPAHFLKQAFLNKKMTIYGWRNKLSYTMAPNRFSSRNGLKHLRFGRNLVQQKSPGRARQAEHAQNPRNKQFVKLLLDFRVNFSMICLANR